MRLLVVEDDPTIADPLCSGLRREGYLVEHASTGNAALDAATPDLVLLDLGLPDLDGRVVCRRLRENSDVPIIVVTARGEEIDRITLFELGADDYVVKPFGFRELVARIRAVLRRAAAGIPEKAPVIQVGVLHIDRRAHQVEYEGRPVALTPKEFDLLVYLAEEAGSVRAREQIINDVWDQNWWGSTKTLDVHVASLRKKLAGDLIQTVRGVGFIIAEPTPESESDATAGPL